MLEDSETSFKQLCRDSFKGIPRFTKSIIALVFILFLVQLVFPSSLHTLALTADFILASSVSFIQLFTAGFLEVNIIILCIDCLVFAWLGKYLEPIWGTREFMKFIFLINIATTMTSYISVILLYMITGKESLLYHYFWCGFSGITCGLLVAIKQLNPEFGISMFFFHIRAKIIPSLIVLVTIVLMCVGIQLHASPFILLGVLYSWLYLRFLQKKGGVVGDLNETFSFSSFFPDALSPIVDMVSGVIYNSFDMCGVWRWLGVSASDNPTQTSKSDSADAERRRKRAAIALEKKLSETDQNTTTTKETLTQVV